MNRYIKILSDIVLLLCLSTYSMCQNLSEFENLKFLSLGMGVQDVCPYEDYDYYVLSVQYASKKFINLDTLCLGSKKCNEILKRMKNKNVLTLHGLWPSYMSGQSMEKNCNLGDEIKIVDESSELFEEMKSVWKSFVNSDEEFWTHEYNKHGYCYTSKYQKTDYREFFKITVDTYTKFNLETLIGQAFGDFSGDKEFDLNDFSDTISKVTKGFTYSLKCRNYSGKQYLMEIRFNFGLDFEPIKSPVKSDSNGNCRKDMPLYLSFY